MSDNWFLIVAVIVIGLLWAGLLYWDKCRKKHLRSGSNPRSLFQELGRAHELDRAERALLAKTVGNQQMKQPALIFLDRDILRAMASSAPESHAYSDLAEKLFGTDAGTGDPAGAG